VGTPVMRPSVVRTTAAMRPAAATPLRVRVGPVGVTRNVRRVAPVRARSVTVQAMADEKDQGGLVADSEVAISKISFGTIGLSVGLSFLVYGFGAFFQFLPFGSISSLLLIYGFPISLIGAALQYAKLDPVPCLSYEKAVALRDAQATSIQLQVRSDVTRYRYGDEQHLDEALKRIFRLGQAGGIAKKAVPKLTGLREVVTEGMYTLTLEFDDNCPFEDFDSRQPKIEGFFGPGVKAVLTKTDAGTDVALISTGDSGTIPDEDDLWEILPPLQPGLPARRVRKGSVPSAPSLKNE